MNVSYSDRARQWGEGFELVQQATDRLKEVLGPSEGVVKAEWDRSEDERGRIRYTLKISEPPEEAEANFTPEELPRSTHMRVRLSHLWGELLKARNCRLMRELQEAGGLED